MLKRFLLIFMLLPVASNAATLTLTAKNITLHQGDAVPAVFTFGAVDSATTYNWTTEVASGYPVTSTTYTPTSPVGTYPITIAVGTMVPQAGYSFIFVAGTLTVEAATGMGANSIVTPVQPAGMMQNLTNALGTCTPLVGDGVTVNAVATTINCYLQTGRSSGGIYGTAPKQFYAPTGVYLFDGQIEPFGSAASLWGDGPDKTIFKLKAAATGYQTGGVDFIYYQGSGPNNGFNLSMVGIGIEIGPGNPAAQALEFIANNFDDTRNVKAWCDDTTCHTGFIYNHAFPGQTTVKDISSFGFNFCIQANVENEYNLVFENVTCENSSVESILTGATTVAMSNLFSVNAPIVWANTSAAQVLLGGEAIGSGTTAITNGVSGTFYVRNFNQTGYTNAMVDSNGSTTLTGNIAEHWSGTAQTLFSTASPTGIIITPVLQTPYPSDPLTGGVLNGCALGANSNNWTSQAAACATSTVYVPVQDNYVANSTVTTNDPNATGVYTPSPGGQITLNLDCNINHFMGNNFTMLSGTGLTINSIGTTCSTTPLIIDHITSTASIPSVNQNTTRPVVIEDMQVNYACSAAGTLFVEDSQMELSPTNFCSGQSIFARGLDAETEGGQFGIPSVAYVQATNILTLQLSANPDVHVGTVVDFFSVTPATWLGTSTAATSAQITSVSGTSPITATAVWSGLGSEANYGPTTQTGGNYRIQYDKIACTGCNLWVMGYKTEKNSNSLNITNGEVEIDGGFFYPLRPSPPGWQAFTLTNTNTFITGSIFGGSQWPEWITETRAGVTRQLVNPGAGGSSTTNMNMFFSIGSGVALPPSVTYGGIMYEGSIH
jgi:MBG domain (YGX type)